ncbi:response regulator transcription factor [uncultured Neptuniibacter sp.]|uniref:response regulator transcription factor n=1 Tax=uncultured Neptuniibacter sp. TaxID=502143 RepID=UPI00261EA2C0|nr:response regulator transcription factor [uncultured Neptuniibacter sp.]
MTAATTPLIYVIEDESDLNQMICSTLNSFRYDARSFLTGESALAELSAMEPEICIVDLNLPDMDGMELVRLLEGKEIGVIIVSGRDGLTDRVLGLEFGADDYITKPFEPREMVARVQSLLRRIRKHKSQQHEKPKLARFGNWTFQPESLSLKHKSKPEESLSRAEGDMLLALLKHPFQILSRDQLLGENCVPYDRSIDVRMSRLRKKIESDPQHPELIKTVYGAGYMFTSEVRWES